MTPRALLTSIGAMAVAFVVAIGVAAGSAKGVDTGQSSHVGVAAFTAEDPVSADASSAGPSTEGPRLASSNVSDPCALAV